MNKAAKLTLLVAILASFVAFLDSAVVNVALPRIQQELGGGLAAQQWIVDGYLLTLGALILLAGSLSDLFGRLKVLRWGLVAFGLASLLCAFAPNNGVLIGARVLQGAAGALLVPSSLALLADRMAGKAFNKAVGSWTAWTGISFIIGPLVGGFLVDAFSWRWIFALNVVPILATLWLMHRLSPDQQHRTQAKVDWLGGALCTIGLGGVVFALIEQPRLGWSDVVIWLPLIIGVASLIGFLWHERHTAAPMLPLNLFNRRNFSFGNIATFLIYGGLSVVTFILVLFLQQVAGYSAVTSGLSLLPITLIMFLGSSRIGGLSATFGPRFFMTTGPLVCAASLVLLALSITASANYWTQVFPGVVLFGIGLTLTVAPLTAAILSDVEAHRSGIASAVNNAVSRIAGLLAIAVSGALLVASFSSVVEQHQAQLDPRLRPVLEVVKTRPLQTTPPADATAHDAELVRAVQTQASLEAFRSITLLTAGFIAAGGLVSLAGIRNKLRKPESLKQSPAP